MIGGQLDNGDIITRDYLSIDENTKIKKVYEWMDDKIPELFRVAVDKLEQTPSFVLEKQSLDPKDSMRCFPRRPEDSRIAWEKDSLSILRLINASTEPFAGAYCFLEGRKVVIWDAEVVGELWPYVAVDGQVIEINNAEETVFVSCGVGTLKLKEIGVDGERGPPTRWIQSIRKRLAHDPTD